MARSLEAPPRRFLPEDFAAGDLAQLEPRLTELADRDLSTAAAVEGWLLDESELFSAYGAELARRYIEMTRHTDSAEAREQFLQLEREVSPRVKVLKDQLDQRLLACAGTATLGPRYDLLLRRRRAAREIFRPANTELERSESELQARQQEIMGGISVSFRGEEMTLQQMGPFLESLERDTRREAYLAALEARRASWPELSRILTDLLRLRTQMAQNAGFDSYTPYRFQQLQRFDYGPDDCLRLHAAIQKVVVPAVERRNARRREELDVESLRPWDLDVDPAGRPPLRPFQSESELCQLVSATLNAVDPRFAEEFAVLEERELLDLMSRKGKAPGGYQYQLEDIRLPFVFANAVGTHRDVQTLLHEAGHAFHSILSRDEPLLDHRDAPIEFAETASMSMELMGLEEIATRYGVDDARHARVAHLEGVLRILPWIASIDAFQHWLYANPAHDEDARAAEWRAIRARFAPGVDYSGVEDALTWQWASQPHLYQHAFYYVEYGIAQVAALQIWRRYRGDAPAAVAAYRDALALGGSRPLPELFDAAGAEFDLSENMLERLVADVEEAMAE
ncbi:MAG: M3 family oligoendopeptidase [Planctomycetota bacterium]